MKVELRAKLSPERVAALEREVSDHDTLERVIRWGLSQKRARFIERVLVQDEYTHDVVIRAGDDCWLVYDTT